MIGNSLVDVTSEFMADILTSTPRHDTDDVHGASGTFSHLEILKVNAEIDEGNVMKLLPMNHRNHLEKKIESEYYEKLFQNTFSPWQESRCPSGYPAHIIFPVILVDP